MKKSNIMATALCAAAVAAAGQDAAPAEEESASFPLLSAAKELELSATLEVTAGWTKQGDDKDFDVNFDTAEIDLGGKVSDRLSVAVALLYEEGEDLCFDVAEFEYEFERAEGVVLHGGLLYLPFGTFETALISDPLTLELGEISAASAGLKWGNDVFEAGAYVFGGELKGDLEDYTDDPDDAGYAAFAKLAPAEGLSFSAAFLSDIGEAGLRDAIADLYDDLSKEAEKEGLDVPWSYDGAPAVNLAVVAELDALTASAEWVAALDDLEICGEEAGKPQAWAVDLAWAVADDWTLACRYEGSKDFLPEEMPETQLAAGAEWAFDEHASVALEYAWGRFEKDEEGERPDDRHMVTGKLAVTF